LDTRELKRRLFDGLVIPAHPLALTAERRLDERRQRGLTRYYLDAGAGGIAIGVHTTQFAIRDPAHELHEPLLRLTIEEIKDYERRAGTRIVKVAGVLGPTAQALREAELAARHGYDAALLGLGWAKGRTLEVILAHCRQVAKVMPLFGFYLQPAAGGVLLPSDFWARFLEIENVVAVKVAPFNRYYTLDVLRPLVEIGRQDEVALYTGNDDTIVVDLVTPFAFEAGGRRVEVRFRGGLLGHWACWTKAAVGLFDRLKAVVRLGGTVPAEILRIGVEVTDMNAAVFDVANAYRGCIAGVHAVLERQGLLAGRWCLDPAEDVSPGQLAEIDRVSRAYPHLVDDAFVAANRDRWLS
jgi:dihydrodipicolinate synthase/N-acetylneuraminate lyase